jgi:hypothetical protein
MNLEGEIEDEGYFWNPETPGTRFLGKLAITRTGSATLTISGNIPEHGVGMFCDNGDLAKYGPVTLLKIFFTGKQGQSFTFSVEEVILGDHITNIFSPEFFEARIAIEGLNEWINFPWLTPTVNKRSKFLRVTSKPARPKKHVINDDLLLYIEQDREANSSDSGNKLTLEQKTFLRFKWKHPQTIYEIQVIAFRINAFLCLMLDHPLSITLIEITKSKKARDRKWAKLIYKSVPDSTSSKISPLHFLVPYQTIESDFAGLFNKYIDLIAEIRIIYDLYFSASAFNHELLEPKFLLLVQGLEVYHRISFRGKVLPRNEFSELKKRLKLACLSPAQIDLIMPKLGYANDFSLRQRLEELLNDIPNSLPMADKEKMVDRATDTRNYNTHFSRRLKTKACFGTDLYNLSNQCKALLFLCILKALGLNTGKIIGISRSRNIERNLLINF